MLLMFIRLNFHLFLVGMLFRNILQSRQLFSSTFVIAEDTV